MEMSKTLNHRDKFIIRRYLFSEIDIEEVCKCYKGRCLDCPMNKNCPIQHACGMYEEENNAPHKALTI